MVECGHGKAEVGSSNLPTGLVSRKMIGKYKCNECKEEFDNKFQALIHHVNTKHESYYLLNTDITMNVKSLDKT